MNIIKFAVYDDYNNVIEYEYSLEQLNHEYNDDEGNYYIPSNDAEIADCELNGIPLYFETFLDLVKTFGFDELELEKMRRKIYEQNDIC